MTPKLKGVKKKESYHKLIVFQKSKEMVLFAYELTNKFPKDEKYIVVPQIRRAAISIMANIVEGYAKKSKKEFVRFLDISIGSCTELEVLLELSYDLGYIKNTDYQKVAGLLLEVKKLLYSFQKSLKVKL